MYSVCRGHQNLTERNIRKDKFSSIKLWDVKTPKIPNGGFLCFVDNFFIGCIIIGQVKLSKKLDLPIILIWSFCAFLLSFGVGVNYLITIFLFSVVPSVYLVWRDRGRALSKTLIFSLVFSIPCLLIIDFLAHKDGSWLNFSTLGLTMFGTYPLDDYLWAVFYIFYFIYFYEYFYDGDHIKRKLPKVFRTFTFIAIILSLLFVIATAYFPGLVIPYFYAWFIFMMVLFFPVIILIRHRISHEAIIKTSLFFIIPSLLYEYVANVMGNWVFPGHHFIGHISMFGVTYPLEEFLWILFIVPAMLAYYEYFADDRR